MDKEPRHLFVYGTLMRGGRSPYARLLQMRASFLGKGYAKGRLFHLGRYPGAVFDPSCAAKVFGEVFRLHSAAILSTLDVYEGCKGLPSDQYRRIVMEAQLLRGRSLFCWTYLFVGDVTFHRPIASGYFAASL